MQKMMNPAFENGTNHTVREMKPEETVMLERFLYEAVFLDEGVQPPSRDIVLRPELQVYIRDFGMQAGDRTFVCECDGKIVGAIWSRIMDDYGHIDNETPSLAISLLKEYRGRGLGTQMMEMMLHHLKEQGYTQVSLSVQKRNYALKLYRKVGFEMIDENEEEVIMKCIL